MGAIDTDLMVVEKEDFSGQLITSNNEIRLGSKYTVLFTVFFEGRVGWLCHYLYMKNNYLFNRLLKFPHGAILWHNALGEICVGPKRSRSMRSAM
jgi:hypothetical protein